MKAKWDALCNVSALLVNFTSLPLSMLHVTFMVLCVLHVLLKYTSKATAQNLISYVNE